MKSCKLTLEYDGTRYSGWQEQRNAKTIQGVVREALEELAGGRVDLGGAGRTDAGVHALGQVAHVRSETNLNASDLFYGLNDRLPPDVNVLKVEPTTKRFHARHDATLRSYIYQISTRRTAFGKKYVWWIKDRLDERAMAEAARMFVGRNDFRSFCDRDRDDASTVVFVQESTLVRHDDLLLYRIAASHFLWRMVRRIVASLAAVGRGQLGARDLERLLRTHSRELAPLTAPPSGLFLDQVLYTPGESLRPLAPALWGR